MSLKPNDVPYCKVEAAKNFIRKPLSEGFRAWSTLRDRDNVTMSIEELGKLMAWYAEIQVQASADDVKKLPPPPHPNAGWKEPQLLNRVVMKQLESSVGTQE